MFAAPKKQLLINIPIAGNKNRLNMHFEMQQRILVTCQKQKRWHDWRTGLCVKGASVRFSSPPRTSSTFLGCTSPSLPPSPLSLVCVRACLPLPLYPVIPTSAF